MSIFALSTHDLFFLTFKKPGHMIKAVHIIIKNKISGSFDINMFQNYQLKKN
jgi:hypothetical protein